MSKTPTNTGAEMTEDFAAETAAFRAAVRDITAAAEADTDEATFDRVAAARFARLADARRNYVAPRSPKPAPLPALTDAQRERIAERRRNR